MPQPRHRGLRTALAGACALLLFAPSNVLAHHQPASAPPAPPARVRVGDPAPELSVDGMVGAGANVAPTPISLKNLRGKAVVLEFSAGWCGPCRALMPHMNELVDAFKNDARITFLTITNEGEAPAARFRESTHMSAPLAWDADGSTWEAYWIRGVPAICLIDAQGTIAAITHPSYLTREILEAFAAGKPFTVENTAAEKEGEVIHPLSWNAGGFDTDPAAIAALLKDMKANDRLDSVLDAEAFAVLRKATKQWSISIGEETAEIRERGAEPATLVSRCFGFDADDTDDQVNLPKDVIYDLFVRPADKDIKTAKAMACSLLQDTFKFNAQVVEKPAPVKLLRRLKDAPPLPAPLGPDGKEHAMMAGSFDVPITTAAELANYLRSYTTLPVADDTGIKEPFSLNLTWNLLAQPDDPDGLTQALRRAGFELADGERPLRRLVLRKR